MVQHLVLLLLQRLGVFFIAFDRGQELVSALSIVTAGATIGFLMWNKSPAKIYMGDAGALFLGIIISVATIRLNPGITPTWQSLAIPVMLLAVPLLDTCVAVFSRLARGLSPLTGGKDHLSHRLVRAGLTRRVAAVSLWSASGVCAVMAVGVYQFADSFGSLVNRWLCRALAFGLGAVSAHPIAGLRTSLFPIRLAAQVVLQWGL
jgi:UDP-GlcNAc:undecaprenyl-phosphate/decaprenyl-phosphate GlcNAc-1-phosphate transferase